MLLTTPATISGTRSVTVRTHSLPCLIASLGSAASGAQYILPSASFVIQLFIKNKKLFIPKISFTSNNYFWF